MPITDDGFDLDDASDGAATSSSSRVCEEPGCVTILSQYNATNWCGLHSRRDWRANREPRRRAAKHDDGVFTDA